MNEYRTNRLIHESSPYLLQHATNPVDWYPWCKEALERARYEDKPIFLSIGYSACHWCHVMAHESFENERIAKIMNDNYINIKVDREERPDLDEIYQKVCQMVTGTGGWPLSAFLTPDLKPFYIGTYFPPEDRYGMPGFATLLVRLADTYKNNREAILKQADLITQGLKKFEESLGSEGKIEKSLLDEAAINLLQSGDLVHGGFGPAPKFPNSTNLAFLLRYYVLSNLKNFKDFVLLTLDKMAQGGIYDQIGGGFHRYSTDSRWLVPHFEKMLYDNALLPILYAEAYQLTKEERYRVIVRETLDYALREMRDKDGGFYSTQDADSEGEEGRYYTWKRSEINVKNAEIVCIYFGITEEGNFEGRNILHRNTPPEIIAKKFSISVEDVNKSIEEAKKELLEIREKREKPARDEKIITSWNSLMISALMKGYKITAEEIYLNAARSCADFIANKLSKNYELNHVFKDGKARLDAYLDDYAFYTAALLDLFEVDPEPEYLDDAIAYTDYMLEHFWDNDLFYTSDRHEELIVRPKQIYDLSIPSGNSVAILDLMRLYHYTQRQEYISKAEFLMKKYSTMASENPFAFGQMLNALYMYIRKPREVTLITDKIEPARWLMNRFLPEGIISITTPKNLDALSRFAFFRGKVSDPSKPFTAYICKDFACSLPLHSIPDIDKHL